MRDLSVKRNHTKSYFQALDSDFRRRLLSWLWDQEYAALFESHRISFPFEAFPTMAGAGKRRLIDTSSHDSLADIQQAHDESPDLFLGYMGYDLKNQLENLNSNHADITDFPATQFFVPEHILLFENDRLIIHSDTDPDKILVQIMQATVKEAVDPRESDLTQDISRDTYIENVNRLRKHIYEGDMYEINYCLHYALKNYGQPPALLYDRLTASSPMPFSCFFRLGDHYLVSASPERFLKKEGNRLISQPIKGTARRSQDPLEDRRITRMLRNDEKEQAENMMIVDLVRNDLAKSSITGSIKVEEIFGIYSFAYLHQMISTVTSTLAADTPFTSAIRHAFPMGSMTGAPKVKVMELIEEFEDKKRGIYSGAAGFITPAGDFDFNVVIRSLFGNLSNDSLRFSVGSAITYDSVPELEYEECLLKAHAILKILRNLGMIK